jgi:hypothetical protein
MGGVFASSELLAKSRQVERIVGKRYRSLCLDQHRLHHTMPAVSDIDDDPEVSAKARLLGVPPSRREALCSDLDSPPVCFELAFHARAKSTSGALLIRQGRELTCHGVYRHGDVLPHLF